MLQVQKRHATTAMDALKALGFLNRHGRVITADRSAIGVALLLTPSGAAHIQAIAHSLDHSSLDCDIGDREKRSEEARRATKGACSDGHCDAGRMQLDSPAVPVPLCRNESAHSTAMQTERAVLTHILTRGLGRIEEREVAARPGRTAPADALRAAVQRLLLSRGNPQDSPTLTLIQLYFRVALCSRLFDDNLLGHAPCCETREQKVMGHLWDGICGKEEAAITDRPAPSCAGLPDEAIMALRAQMPSRWERLGDIALLPNQSFASPVWASLGSELWEAVAAALGVARLARQSPVANTGAHALQ